MKLLLDKFIMICYTILQNIKKQIRRVVKKMKLFGFWTKRKQRKNLEKKIVELQRPEEIVVENQYIAMSKMADIFLKLDKEISELLDVVETKKRELEEAVIQQLEEILPTEIKIEDYKTAVLNAQKEVGKKQKIKNLQREIAKRRFPENFGFI